MRTESATTTTAVTATQRRPNFFALTGAMVTEDRALAFFSGSPSDYNKVLRAGEAIADYKITNVSAKGVELAREGKTISLNVGQQIPLDGGGPRRADRDVLRFQSHVCIRSGCGQQR
jgi:hypothetical protein